MRKSILGVLACLLVTSLAIARVAGQTSNSIKDISLIYAEGKITGDQYTNEYFGLVLKPVGAQFTKGGFISPQGKKARLIAAEANAEKWEDKYSIAVLADALSVHPSVRSPEQYLRGVQSHFQGLGSVLVQDSTPVEVSGIRFVRMILKAGGERPHYQGMYTAFLKGYILTLQIEAPSPERLTQIVQSTVHFSAVRK